MTVLQNENREKTSKQRFINRSFLVKYSAWIIFFGLVILATLLSPKFLTYRNLFNVLRQVSILGVLAVGITFVIISGGIDLSVGGVLALSCVLVPLIYNRLGDSILVIILICIAAGAILGGLTGTLISYGKMQPFMASFGMATIAEGLAFLLSDGRPIILSDQRWPEFGNGSSFGVPNLAIIFLITIIIGQIILSQTKFGVNVFAIGNNELATSLSGVRTRPVKFTVYLISGALAATGGLMMTARIGVGDPGVGAGYALDAIAAVIVGGTRMGGGYGSIINTLLGAFMIGILNNVFNLLGISPYPQMIFKGMIIIVAVLAGQRKK